MSGAANVRSIAAIRDFKTAMARFYEATSRSLIGADADVRRAVSEIGQGIPSHWRSEIGRLERAVVQAKVDLEQAQFAAEMGKSTVDERKRLSRLRDELETAKRQAEVTKRWGFAIDREALQFRAQTQALRSLLEVGSERPLSRLESLARRLEEYVEFGYSGSIAASDASEPSAVSSSGRTSEKQQSAPITKLRGEWIPTRDRHALPSDHAVERAVMGSFDDLPQIHFDPAIRTALAGLVTSAPPNRAQHLTVHSVMHDPDATVFVRVAAVDEHDSGWRVLTPIVPDSVATRRVRHLDVLTPAPEVGEILRLPVGWSVVCRSGVPIEAVSPTGDRHALTMQR